MKINKFITKTAKETQNIARIFAKKILKKKLGKATVIGLIGELGSGKTTFTKGFARGFGVKHVIQSPTFIIARRHDPKGSRYKSFYHIDAYRIGPKDLLALGWRGWVKNPANIILVEWADRIFKILPKRFIKIHFETLRNGQRKITLK